eukprot:Seg595.1 transcript_id=Seg595.1/GoldUCD/mRNA.D3Y31 product="Dual specificity protein phosphatase 18" protein_id=Seg595.1/GoldUCD/D3Y31
MYPNIAQEMVLSQLAKNFLVSRQPEELSMELTMSETKPLVVTRSFDLECKMFGKSKKDHGESLRRNQEKTVVANLTKKVYSRDDASEVYPFLYIGNLASRNTKFLTEKNVVMIINASNMNPKTITGCSQPYDIEEMLVALSDMGQANIREYFDVASQKIDEVEKSKGATLVHCVAGISRSASLVLAFLMKYKKMTLREAHRFLKSRRRIVRPNPGFWMQLIEYERQLFGKNTVEMISCPAAQAKKSSEETNVMIPDVYKDEYKNMII